MSLASAPHPFPDELHAAADRLGIESVTALGEAGSSFLLNTRRGRIVAKSIDRRRDPRDYRATMQRLAASRPPLCPPLIDTVDASGDRWFALFEYVEGHTGARLADVLELLVRLRDAEAVPTWPLQSWWLECLSAAQPGDPAEARLLARLSSTAPSGPLTLAHGDFNLPNIVAGRRGPLLLDWEEPGAAPLGFDAGWLMALARAGAGVPWPYDDLRRALADTGIPEANLRWFERLGVLRLLFRARTVPMPEPARPLLVAAIRRVVVGLAPHRWS